jgi:hypothetical protein
MAKQTHSTVRMRRSSSKRVTWLVALQERIMTRPWGEKQEYMNNSVSHAQRTPWQLAFMG